MREVVSRRLAVLPLLAALCGGLGWSQGRQNSRASEDSEQLGQLDSSEALFAVMAAITAGGYNAESESPTNHPIRKQLRDYFAGQTLPSIDALRRYVRDHKPRNPALELNQYISYALLVKGPPNFGWREPNLPPPPDVAAIDDFTPLLIDFYREAKIGELWKRVRPAYDQVIAQYHEAVSRAVLAANSYLRNPTSGYPGRHFQILIDLLGAPNQVQTRHYLDDDTVVVTHHEDPLPVAEIRHAYLRHLIDPLSFKFAPVLKAKAGLADYALGSPILEEHYKADFGLLATECLIKAIESRIDRKPALVDQALREGFVVTPAFAELLIPYEKQEQSMRLYFPQLVTAIDLKKEEKRLDRIDFVSERATRVTRVTKVVEDTPVLSGAAKTLDIAEQSYTARDLAKAKDTYLQVLQQTGEKSMHAKAYYGLARIAVLERDPETGDRLFRKVLELDPDPVTKAWSLVYIGKLADSQGEKQEAQENYKAALAVAGASEAARQEAEKGSKGAFAKN
jgi:predicted negative regulator of RcsB-dependent stress response